METQSSLEQDGVQKRCSPTVYLLPAPRSDTSTLQPAPNPESTGHKTNKTAGQASTTDRHQPLCRPLFTAHSPNLKPAISHL